MRKYLIFLLTALLLPTSVEANWFGKYNSRYDANEACEIWMLKGFKYTYKVMGRTGLGTDNKYYKLYNKYDPGLFNPYHSDYLSEADKLIDQTRSGFSRSCLEEKETNQFIGREKSCLKKKDYSLAEWKKLFELKSCEKRKYFKY